MTDRNKTIISLVILLALLVAFFSRTLFTDKIIRAPDIINEFYWGAVAQSGKGFVETFKTDILQAPWNYFVNSGYTNEGGDVAGQFLYPVRIILSLIPPPTSIAWIIVLHLFFGAAGTYFCCRAVGASHVAAFIGGVIFALAPENASLINAGHVMKLATISYAPWAFYFLERGFQARRVVYFMVTGFVLAFQFFNTHWQIAYYTCLCIGAYGVLRSIGILVAERGNARSLFPRLLGLNAVLLVFFLTTVSISLLPLANWSMETNRGVSSGANRGAGGLNVEEAMSWSLPPEEVITFVIPGFFGLSRQEGGANPDNISSYYWGRMVFTQTTDYMGLLPWLLLPLPLIFRRDRYTWLPLAGVVGGLFFSFGKYTPFYWALYQYFPGIDHFRVPKMMMFIPVLGLAVLAARGIDLLRDGEARETRAFRAYRVGVLALPVLLLALWLVEVLGERYWIGVLSEMLTQPTRYESGPYLAGQRWNNLVRETGLAAGLAAVYGAVLWAGIGRRSLVPLLPAALFMIYVGDVWRINDKFMFMVSAPVLAAQGESPVMDFLARMPHTYRVLPMDGSDPMLYVNRKIPVMFTSNPVQQVRWQEYLDNFNLASSMPDLMNVKYLVYGAAQYAQDKTVLDGKYVPVVTSSDGKQIVLENRTVLPKGWLVPQVAVIPDSRQAFAILQSSQFNPWQHALVESPPPIPLAPLGEVIAVPPGEARVTRYEGERIGLSVTASRNVLLVLGEKYYRGWKAFVDGKEQPIYPVNRVQRGIYLPPGTHRVEFLFDPLPFKVGKYLTLASFALFAAMLGREWWRRKGPGSEG